MEVSVNLPVKIECGEAGRVAMVVAETRKAGCVVDVGELAAES
jgi:hypothetical protein